MNKEMRKFYRKLMKMDNEGVTFRKYDGKIISDFEAEDLNLPEGYSIVNNEIFNGDTKIGELEVTSFDENEDINLEDFEDLDIDFEEDEEKERRFSFRRGLNSIRYGISNFFGNFGKRRNIELEDETMDLDEDETMNLDEDEIVQNTNNIKNSLDINEILDEIIRLNPSKNIEYNPTNNRIIIDVNPEELELPEGFYYNKKNGITNKHNTESGAYITISVDSSFVEKQSIKTVPASVDNGFENNSSMPDEDDEEFDVEFKEPKRVKVFRKLRGAAVLTGSAIRNFFYGIANNTSRFFENFGKRKELSIDEDIFLDNEDMFDNNQDVTSSKKDSVIEKSNRKSSNIEELSEKMDELTKRYAELNGLTSNKIDSLDDETKAKYAYTADTANSILLGLNKEQITEMYKNGGRDSLNNYFNSKFTLEERINRVEATIKYLEDVNKSLDEDLAKSNKKTLVTNEVKKYNFTSKEDVKAKFKEFDNYEEVKEKIKYYEDFLKTHDLSHPDDQPMKERMEQKLADLKAIYSDKVDNTDSRTEKMAYYTQVSMGIDKKIDRINKERQLKILQAELEGKTVVNLGLAEERKIDEEKIKLLKLKRECLERKAEVNKYYEEMAARMTAALKR